MWLVPLLIIAVGWTLYKRFRARSVRYAELNKDVTVDDVESLKVPPFVGVATSGLMLLFFLVGLIMAFDFSETGRLFPFIVGGAGVLLGLLSLVGDLREVRSAGGLGRVEGEFRQQVKVVAISALWLLGFIWAVFAIGMYAGTAVFCVIFLLVVAQMKPLATLVYTVAIVGTLYMLASFAELVPPVGWLF